MREAKASSGVLVLNASDHSHFCCYLFTRYPWNGNELYDWDFLGESAASAVCNGVQCVSL